VAVLEQMHYTITKPVEPSADEPPADAHQDAAESTAENAAENAAEDDREEGDPERAADHDHAPPDMAADRAR
jgi:hypothetical protein